MHQSMRNTHSLKSMVAILVTASSLMGCVTTSTVSLPPEVQVQQKAQARWNARIVGDLKSDYALHSPSYRSTTSLEDYTRGFGAAVTWVSGTVIGTQCEVERCVARLKIEVKPVLQRRNAANIETHFDEVWILEDGQWWFHPKL